MNLTKKMKDQETELFQSIQAAGCGWLHELVITSRWTPRVVASLVKKELIDTTYIEKEPGTYATWVSLVDKR